MDANGRKSNSPRDSDDDSLGILNVDILKGRGRFFGDVSYPSEENKNRNSSHGRINDRLNMERKKALEALQKSEKYDTSHRSMATANKENMMSLLKAPENSPIPHDRTDYVPFRRPQTINISDLVTDVTIQLETTSSCPPSAAKDGKISFEPSEMTGRSTLYKKDVRQAPIKNTARQTMSVSDILASSFAQKARNLCDTLNSGDCTFNNNAEKVSGCTSYNSFVNYNDSKSLPRTADLSLTNNSYSKYSFTGDAVHTFSLNNGAGASNKSYVSNNESFAPGELMQSKLDLDEISWAQQYAAIPAATLSENARAKAAGRVSPVNTNGFEPPSASNSIIAGDPNFSVGNFFQMRSENIWDMVKSKSPDKCRTPFALMDNEDGSSRTISSSSVEGVSVPPNLSTIPQIDNKTYTRVSGQLQNVGQDSKDSGNSTDNSYLLSVSAIDKALCSLEKTSSINPNNEQFLKLTKKSKSLIDPKQSIDESVYSRLKNMSLQTLQTQAAYGNKSKLQSGADIILENFENLNPEIIRGSSKRSELSDTLSFTESILNSSDMKQMENRQNQQRSPLRPIDFNEGNVPNIQITDATAGEEGDNEEWSITPAKKGNCRVRRTKSPHNKSSLGNNSVNEESSDATTPVNCKPKGSMVANNNNNSNKDPKSLCSTRLDGGEHNQCDLGISPNLSANKSPGQLGRSNTLTNMSPGNSPFSTTTRSFHSALSPTPTNMDTTSNSDRQLLSNGVAPKAVSSPVGSESSSTYSYGTMHSGRSNAITATMRSISRCSTTSEFSHRDGKPIPLKVTNTELSWGSVKLRSDSRKSMQIKNIINKRLVIRMEVSGPGFQIVSNNRSNNITMQSQECRTINISFCPTVMGVAIGKLSFFAPTAAPAQCHSFMELPLYGYGGNANVVPQKITLGPVGSPFITMGDICELAKPLQRTVRLYNKGPLLAFAVIMVDSLGLKFTQISNAFEIFPQKVLIPSHCSMDIKILFKPKREEIKKILKKIECVLALANLRVISGDEANRQRTCRLVAQMNESERSKMSCPSLDMLWSSFPNEQEITELAAIRENPNNLMDLASGCKIHEILLTINRENLDDTADASSLFLPEGDDTVLFRTVICAADSNSPTPPTSLGTVSEMYEENANEAEQLDRKASWSVKPSFIEINLNSNEHVSLFVYNGFKSRQYFEVACSNKNLLRFSPCEGYVAPDNGQTEIVIELNRNVVRDYAEKDVFIMVNMENERIMVPVKIQGDS